LNNVQRMCMCRVVGAAHQHKQIAAAEHDLVVGRYGRHAEGKKACKVLEVQPLVVDVKEIVAGKNDPGHSTGAQLGLVRHVWLVRITIAARRIRPLRNGVAIGDEILGVPCRQPCSRHLPNLVGR